MRAWIGCGGWRRHSTSWPTNWIQISMSDVIQSIEWLYRCQLHVPHLDITPRAYKLPSNIVGWVRQATSQSVGHRAHRLIRFSRQFQRHIRIQFDYALLLGRNGRISTQRPDIRLINGNEAIIGALNLPELFCSGSYPRKRIAVIW